MTREEKRELRRLHETCDGPQHGGWKRMIELEGKARVHAHQVNQDQIRNAVHSGDIDLAADLSRNAGGEA